MDVMKKFLCRIGHFFLTIINVLRRAICCRRKKEADYLLPLTIDQVDAGTHVSTDSYDFPSQWESWPDTNNLSTIPASNVNDKNLCQTFHHEDNPDDFFKDMVPQIRKPKKIYIRKDMDEREENISLNRLAVDPKAMLPGPDLGAIDDNPSNWEDDENLEEVWDPNELIRETKRAEREKRLAEHQRRKQERENKRASKQDSSGIAILNLSDSKAKSS